MYRQRESQDIPDLEIQMSGHEVLVLLGVVAGESGGRSVVPSVLKVIWHF